MSKCSCTFGNGKTRHDPGCFYRPIQPEAVTDHAPMPDFVLPDTGRQLRLLEAYSAELHRLEDAGIVVEWPDE